MKLYSYYRSSCSWRVRIALEHKNIPYEYVPVNLLKNEQASAEYLKVNPSAAVPSLQMDGHIITQSVAILEYLEETWPQRPLLPQDPIKRAIVRQAVQVIAADTQPLQNLSVMQKLNDMESGFDEDGWCRHWIGRGLAAVEAKLANGASTFAMGTKPSLVDVFVVPQLYNARRFAMEMAPYPTLLRVERACEALPAFVNAHPDRQPDAQAPTERKP